MVQLHISSMWFFSKKKSKPHPINFLIAPNRTDLTSKPNSNHTEFCGAVSVQFCGLGKYHNGSVKGFCETFESFVIHTTFESLVIHTTFERYKLLSKTSVKLSKASWYTAFESLVIHTSFIRFSVGSIYITAESNQTA